MKALNDNYDLGSTLEQLEENTNTQILAKKQKIAELDRQIDDLTRRERRIQHNLPKLINALELERLEIIDIGFYNQGIEFEVIPRGKYHKRIQYVQDGVDILYEKADNLMKSLSDHVETDFEWDVNPYEFEKYGDTNDNYIIQARFKF